VLDQAAKVNTGPPGLKDGRGIIRPVVSVLPTLISSGGFFVSDRVTVITVSFNSAAVLGNMLASLPADQPVVVVDNNSVDDSAAIARQAGAMVRPQPVNRGFGPSCNAGAVDLDTEFLFFLNPDTEVQAGALDAMVACMDQHPEASACNPKIANGNGAPAFKRGSTLLPKSQWAARGWPATTGEVAVLSGAALFVRRAAFEQVGGFDPKIFLYHEDDDLSLRLQQQAGPLLFVADAMIQHLEGRSSARTADTAAWKAYHLARSRIYAMRKHNLPNPFASSLREALLKCISPVSLLSGRKRAQAFGFLRGVLSARQATDALDDGNAQK
jgi:GT2 family glycosyltransferase